jgi:outer membrane lipoprotein-sorting protein
MIPRRGLIFGLMALCVASAAAEATWSAALSPEDQALVDQAVRYLDGLTCAEGRFIQTDGAGRQEAGAFWLQRPGRARFDYDPPSGLAMASDGRLVSVVNHRLKTIQNYPLGFTPLSIFLSRNIRLGGKVKLENVTASDSALHITLVDGRGSRHGSIRLDFKRSPISLTGWMLIDSRGQGVEVRLTHLEPSAPKPKAFFDIYDPSLQGIATGGVSSPK